ncbi:unnamed protein product [Bursaphelenchus xylophilus]|uniref:(pine wood nematode) hypothetical protein n=1 Tax=Bursaphelenchus xylophilus TaxID=6326 RepID=A0A1I7RVH1_BURXY|nr:unnamed protein product [Bursaphelenchus xylophilus]CAG9104082.1 unnamed protein product [Bursaphelenchus xylophilus]
MTAILSFLCSEPLVSSCAARRTADSSDENYLLDSDSWDLCTESTSKEYEKVLARSPTVWSEDSGKGEGQKRRHRLRRIMNIFGSALNPLKWSREWSTDSVDSGYHGAYHPHRPGQVGPSRTVSFADRPSARYRILSETENSSDEDSEVQHFAIVDIVPGKKPRWISDATRLEERSRWTNDKKPHSFDSTLQRRRSLSAQRTCRLNRRAYSLNRVMELDAAVRRNEYAAKMAKRPESSYIENSTHLYRDYSDYKEPIFYSNGDDETYGEVELHDQDPLPWNHPSRPFNRSENNAPPRPPKPSTLNPETAHYTNEIMAPPRPPKRISTTVVMSSQSTQPRLLRRQKHTEIL